MQPLLLVRHAEAGHHVQDLTGGWTDSDLTRRGQRQAELLALRLQRELSGRTVDLLSSDLRRALQTASILSQALGISIRSEPALRDLNNGQAAGLSHAAAETLRRPHSEPFLDWIPYPGAESWRQFSERVNAFLESFIPEQDRPAVLVTHGLTIHAIVQWWLGLGTERRVHFSAEPGSLTVLRTTRWQERSIERLNDTAHLQADGLGRGIHL
jgi:broad specificity phosphatase PhoE